MAEGESKPIKMSIKVINTGQKEKCTLESNDFEAFLAVLEPIAKMKAECILDDFCVRIGKKNTTEVTD